MACLTGAQARSTAHPVAQTVGRVEKTVALVGRWQTAMAEAAVLAGRQIMDGQLVTTPPVYATLAVAVVALAATAVQLVAMAAPATAQVQQPLALVAQVAVLAPVVVVVVVMGESVLPLNMKNSFWLSAELVGVV